VLSLQITHKEVHILGRGTLSKVKSKDKLYVGRGYAVVSQIVCGQKPMYSSRRHVVFRGQSCLFCAIWFEYYLM